MTIQCFSARAARRQQKRVGCEQKKDGSHRAQPKLRAGSLHAPSGVARLLALQKDAVRIELAFGLVRVDTQVELRPADARIRFAFL